MKLLLSLISTLLVTSILAQDTNQNIDNHKPETLIIVDKSNSIATFNQNYATFVKLIKDLGHQTSIKAADDSSLKLVKYGEFKYDNIVLFCPQGESLRGTTLVRDILEFIDSGRNVLLVGSNSPSAKLQELARGVGFEFKESGVRRDYPNSKLNPIEHLVGHTDTYTSSPFSFAGTQLKMLKSDLTSEILLNNAPVDDIRPSGTSKYSTNVLIGATQARNNARVVVSGSADFFSDKAFEASKLANKKLATELLSWLAKEKSLLRYTDVQHKKLVADIAPLDTTDIAMKTNVKDGYTIMDDIEYSIKIEIYEDNNWKPYVADDVQLEFVRIDPFVRLTMTGHSNGTYVARFKVPDVYGVYKFQVDYHKPGLTHLLSSTQVSVRPLRHNQYERYIFSAYPYYLSAFLMMVYLYIFSFVHLYQQKEKRNNK